MRATAELPFADRRSAGRRLAAELPAGRLGDAVVVGLARGGVVVAAEVAAALGLPLDAVAVRKVGHPWQPEYALGAVAPGAGAVYLRTSGGLPPDVVERIVAEARGRTEELDRRLHADRPPVAIAGRTCLLVDDGLATGASMTAAVEWARARGAARVVVAVPVGAGTTVRQLQLDADEVFCLEDVSDLGAVGLWYDRFDQVSDDEVVELLRGAALEPGVRA